VLETQIIGRAVEEHCAQHLSASDRVEQALLFLCVRHASGMNELEHCSFKIEKNSLTKTKPPPSLHPCNSVNNPRAARVK